MSDPASSPGTVDVIFLHARLAMRRWINRVSAGFRRKKAEGPDAPRAGTARKGGGGVVGMAFLGLMFMGYGFFLSWQFLGNLAHSLESRSGERIVLAGPAYRWLEKEVGNLTNPSLSEAGRSLHRQRVRDVLAQESFLSELPAPEREKQLEERMRVLQEKGISGFRCSDDATRTLLNDRREAGLRAVGVVLFLLAFSQIWLGLGTGNQDLGKVEWSLEWLFTFPAPAGRIFLAKVLEGALINPTGWFLIMPFLCMLYWTADFEGWAFPLGAITMLFLGLVLASVRVVLETWLRMVLSLDRLKNIQALCTVVGTCIWLGILAIAFARPTPSFFIDLAPRVPTEALWNPLSLPVLLCGQGGMLWSSVGAMAVLAVLIPLAAVALCRHFVRDGLLTTSGTFQGVRRAPAAPAEAGRRPLLHGVVAKDLRLLLRDRNFLVSTLVVPVILFAFQVVLNPGLIRGVTGDYRHAATLAYGLGAFILLSSAFHILSVEGGALWLLYTFPRELHSILVQKTIIWAVVALVYAGIVLGVTAAFNRSLDFDALALGVTAAVGVVLSAFIAGALGALGTDPLQHEPQRKVRPEIVYLYFLLSSMYGYAIYGPSGWARLVQVILSALLVLALWQKVRDRLPYLLDPTEMPPPTITVSDGLIATLAFFILQGLISILMVTAGTPPGQTILVAYVGAGGLVALFTLVLFWRLKVPRVFEAVGIRSPGASIGRSLGIGVATGIFAAGIGLLYLWIVDRVEPLRALKEEALQSVQGLQQGGTAWLVILAVVAAPIFEEYLFRGLVFKGLRQMMKPAFAILASAAIFAIVHPPLSFVPVFGLGIAAAIAFEGSGSLLAPLLTHAIYNSAVVFLSR